MPRIYFTLKFDAETEQAIRALWRKIAERGIPVEGLTGYRPHVTLAGYATDNIAPFKKGIVPVVKAMRRFPIRLEGIGIFPPAHVIFLQPCVTEKLLTLHTTILDTFHRPELPPLSHEHFGVGRWMPHCMLTRRVSVEQMQIVLQCCLYEWHSLEGYAEGLGMRLYPAVTDAHYFTLDAA